MNELGHRFSKPKMANRREQEIQRTQWRSDVDSKQSEGRFISSSYIVIRSWILTTIPTIPVSVTSQLNHEWLDGQMRHLHESRFECAYADW